MALSPSTKLDTAARYGRLGQADEGAGGAKWHRLQGLTNLRKLYLAGNGLAAVPSVISTLTTLTFLDLHHNSLYHPGGRGDSGLSHVRPLAPGLRRLDLSNGRRWEDFPWLGDEADDDELEDEPEQPDGSCQLSAELSYLTCLTWLALRCTPATRWEVLAALPQLRYLQIRQCKLRQWPHPLSALTALTELDASCNRFHHTDDARWEVLCALPALQRLDLSDSLRLWQVPGALSQLTALTHLKLKGSECLHNAWLDLSPEQAAEAVRSNTQVAGVGGPHVSHERSQRGWRHIPGRNGSPGMDVRETNHVSRCRLW